MAGLPEISERRLVIGIDYGTTYTGVSIATPEGNRAHLDEIDVVNDWGPGMGNHPKIPSVISYSLRSARREQQWGTDLAPGSIAMVHTKLQLDVDDTSTELDLILQALEGMHSLDFRYVRQPGVLKYPSQSPEQIVEDYLERVFEYLLEAVSSFTEELRQHIPVDIVATIPAKWGYRAKNSTFRALTRAGFNKETFPKLRDMMLVSEPEAAAIYTARYLKEERGGREIFRLNECFVLCDAGGGTVDVVSYKVKQLDPFEIERVTLPSGRKCGSIFINLAFKQWLRELIGDEFYRELDETQLSAGIGSHDSESERIRQLIRAFEIHKKRFTRASRDIRLTLPEPLQDETIDGRVEEGQFTITNEDMVSFFEPCAEKIVELIQDQIDQVRSQQKVRPKNVFLVGGFAESPYLQDRIKNSLDMRGLNMQVPDTSLTAVVRGATIFGIEKLSNRSLSKMTACNRSYGVSVTVPYSEINNRPDDLVKDKMTKTEMAKDQLMWLIKKGDLILSNQPKAVSGSFTETFTVGTSRMGIIPIYAYDHDDRPDRLSDSEGELEKVYELRYNLNEIPLKAPDFIYSKSSGKKSAFYTVSLVLNMRIDIGNVHVELLLGNRVITTADIEEEIYEEAPAYIPEDAPAYIP